MLHIYILENPTRHLFFFNEESQLAWVWSKNTCGVRPSLGICSCHKAISVNYLNGHFVELSWVHLLVLTQARPLVIISLNFKPQLLFCKMCTGLLWDTDDLIHVNTGHNDKHMVNTWEICVILDKLTDSICSMNILILLLSVFISRNIKNS